MRKRHTAWAGVWGTLFLVAGVAFSFLTGGCGKSKTSSSQKSSSVKGNTKKQKAKPPLDGWPKPAFALVLSGEQNGYLEPCGCTAENQMGGMSHRADLFRIIREKGWPVTAFDLGGAIYRTRKQDEFKLKAILSGFQTLGYTAAALGTKEMEFARDTDFLLTLPNLSPDEEETKPPYVAANVNIEDFGPRKTQIVKVGGKIIGVTAVFGKKYQRKILPEGSTAKPEMTDPKTELKAALAELKKQKPDFLVLLSHASMEESREYAKTFPDTFDVVLSADGPEDGIPKPELIGKTRLLNVGLKGKHVGVVGFYPDEKDEQKRLRFELVELDGKRFKDVESMRQLMREYQKELYGNHADIFAEVKFGPHPSGSTYVGAKKCGECHTKAYAKWKTTKHAKAYDGLLLGREDQRLKGIKPIKRDYDPECLACHVTGWDAEKFLRYDSGFQIKELAESAGKPELYSLLKGQQCENCHGPGSQHTTLEEAWKIDPKPELNDRLIKLRNDMKLTVELAKERRTCYKCHDLDNSPNFKFDKYWKEVEHKGKD
ncbi:MAG: hypothetical protein Tsb009_23330 [Planctomycetaceae bacterium]